ncbi:MAG TPA: hypothetical protein VLJ88_07590 [Propionibacteriaceae bacterium]|nr:hypothetical protein [Propionibacteriaceae bacterium]
MANLPASSSPERTPPGLGLILAAAWTLLAAAVIVRQRRALRGQKGLISSGQDH